MQATFIIGRDIPHEHKMSFPELLQILANLILILKEAVHQRVLVLKLLSSIVAILKRVGGAFIVIIGSMWMGVLPVSMWTSARTIPAMNPYSWAFTLVMMILFGSVLEMFGLLAVGYGSMFVVPNSRFGRHFRCRVFVKKNKPTFTSQRMPYMIIARLFGQLRVRRA